jgi:hypothetical protein
MSSSVIEMLKHGVETFSDRYCTLSVDEMAFKANLSYEAAKDKIIGFVDHGVIGKTCDPANQDQVLMIREYSVSGSNLWEFIFPKMQ